MMDLRDSINELGFESFEDIVEKRMLGELVEIIFDKSESFKEFSDAMENLWMEWQIFGDWDEFRDTVNNVHKIYEVE